jgi:nitroimidazol reductase NimA-like FMN-containing flavoprotein (pyridoxamine 5'-phosphate oxidase superfamily)
MREMRHADRVRSKEWALEKLAETNIVFIAMNNEVPYCIPVSHILWQGHLYFHAAAKGLKTELLAKDPRVCITAVSKAEPDIAGMTVQYQSVVAYGVQRLSPMLEEKIEALRQICSKHTPGNQKTKPVQCVEDNEPMLLFTESPWRRSAVKNEDRKANYN